MGIYECIYECRLLALITVLLNIHFISFREGAKIVNLGVKGFIQFRAVKFL